MRILKLQLEVISAETSLFAPPDEVERLKSVCFQVQRRLMTGQPGKRQVPKLHSKTYYDIADCV